MFFRVAKLCTCFQLMEEEQTKACMRGDRWSSKVRAVLRWRREITRRREITNRKEQGQRRKQDVTSSPTRRFCE